MALTLLLTGCTTTGGSGQFRQAAAAPRPAPVAVPQFQQPPHTPRGAGASPLGQPWQAPGPPRSPNRRILPPSPEPGLWAADEVTAVTRRNQNDIPAMLAGVRLPSPTGESTEATRKCADSMNHALRNLRLHIAMAQLPPDVRTCIAARLFEYCAIQQAFKLHRKLVATNAESSRAMVRRESAVGVAVPFAQDACNEKTYPHEALDIYNRTADEWARQSRMANEEK